MVVFTGVHVLSDFLGNLDATLKIAAKEGREIYSCGDFNINLLKTNRINPFLTLYNMLSAYGLFPLILPK